MDFATDEQVAAFRYGLIAPILSRQTLAWAFLFSVARRVVESDKYTRMGKFVGWGPMLFLGQDVIHKTVGVIGAGRIGLSFTKRAKAFDMTVLYTDLALKHSI